MFDRLDDTIVAISSPPGRGIRGIVRLSGPRAFELADAIFASDDGNRLIEVGGHQRRLGKLWLEEHASLPAEVYTFRAPASYTRQDLIELHAPGSPPVLAIVLEHLVEAGARVAQPGEFTGRAFLGGAIDLTEVEGVAAMIHAQTDAQLRASETLLHGALSRQTREMREELADLLALIEAEIDFAEEPVEFVSPARVLEIVSRIASRLEELLNRSQSVERLQVLPRIVFVGLPNAGKSTLFNRLTGVDRAIQSAVAGTTRDVISAPMVLPGGEAILCDTAGMPDCLKNFDSGSAGRLAQAIQAATERAIATAELILVVIDASDAPMQALSVMSERLSGRRFEIVLNKVDAITDPIPAAMRHTFAVVSAKLGDGLDVMRSRINDILFEHAEKQGIALISLTERHRGALHDAREALMRGVELIGSSSDQQPVRTELLAMEIRHATHALSLLLGEVTTEDLLGRIFARFCIGK